MRAVHATFEKGGFTFENGIDDMQNRLARGGLRVAEHLFEWFDEYIGYHRESGLVVKVDDDLMSATRQLMMDVRFAKPVSQFADFVQWDRAGRTQAIASGVDFDLFAGQ